MRHVRRSLCLVLALVAVASVPANSQAPATTGGDLHALEQMVLKKGPNQQLFDTLQRIIEAQPNNPQAHYVLGLAFKKSGYDQLATEQFDQVKKLDSGYVKQVLQQFRQALADEELGVATDESAFVRSMDPVFPALLYYNGLELRDQGRLGEAAAAFNGARLRDPSLVGPASGLGSVFFLSGRNQRALKLAQIDIGRKPRHHQANVVAGQALLGLQRYDEALKPLQIAYETGPTWPGCGYYYADNLVRLGRFDEALAPCIVDMACEQKSDAMQRTKALLVQIIPRLSSDAVAKGIKQADQTLASNPNHTRMYFALSDVFDRLGENLVAGAIRYKGLQMDPAYTHGWFRMAQSMERAHNYGYARFCYDRAYQQDPRNSDYIHVRERISQRYPNWQNDLAWRFKNWLQSTTHPQNVKTKDAVAASLKG